MHNSFIPFMNIYVLGAGNMISLLLLLLSESVSVCLSVKKNRFGEYPPARKERCLIFTVLSSCLTELAQRDRGLGLGLVNSKHEIRLTSYLNKEHYST